MSYHQVRLEGNLYLTVSDEVARIPPGIFPSIDGTDIYAAVNALCDLGIGIEPALSERDVTYRCGNNERATTVPLDTQFPLNVCARTEAYRLHDRLGYVGIELADFVRTHPERAPVGMQVYTGGILCTMELHGPYDTDSWQNTLEGTVQNLYSAENSMMNLPE